MSFMVFDFSYHKHKYIKHILRSGRYHTSVQRANWESSKVTYLSYNGKA